MRAQISILILLGVVILIIIGMLYLISSVGKIKNIPEARLAPIVQFYEDCVDTTTQEGVILLLKQGGFIFDHQGGPEPDPSFQNDPSMPSGVNLGQTHVLFNGEFVPFSITANTISSPLYYATPPNYPWDFFPYTNAASTQTQYIGFFSSPLAIRPRKIDDGQLSWEQQLMNYIDNNLGSCTTHTFQGYDLTVEGSVVSNVTISPDRITVGIEYPVLVESTTSKALTRLNNFNSQQRIRLGSFYAFILNTLNSDATDMSFDLNTASALGFDVRVFDDDSGEHSVIEIVDATQNLRGQDVVFRTARQNHRPALVLIRPSTSTRAAPYTFTESDFNAQALDIDEDAMSFSFNPPLPHIVASPGTTTFNVIVSDGIFSDSQQVSMVVSP